MSFETITIVTKVRQPASVCLIDSADTGQPRCRIAISRELAEKVGITSKGDRFELALGSGEHAGIARLRRHRLGALAPVIGAKGGIWFNCGHIERFGAVAEKKQFCKAEAVDKDTILVTLPSWAGA